MNLITRYAPAEHQKDAQGLLMAMKGGSQSDAGFGPGAGAGNDAAGLLALAATSAWLAVHPKVFRSRETARLTLIQEIRKSEAKALKTPDWEMSLFRPHADAAR